MFKKIIASLILFIAMFSCISYAENAAKGPWKWYYSDSYQTRHFNPESITYDKKNNIATVWDKAIWTTKTESVMRIKIDFSNKTSQMIGYIDSKGTEKISSKDNPNSGINPGSPSEALANVVSDQLNIPHVYKGGPDRWQWFHSTNTESYYIATDATSYNPKTNRYSVWIRTVRPINGSDYAIQYIFDFKNHEWGYPDSKNMKPIEPNTWQEINYNGAYDLCKKLYGITDKKSAIDNFGFLSTQQTE